MQHSLPTAKFANLHFVTPQLAIGGDLTTDDDDLAFVQFAEIVDLGITHIIDVRIEWSDAETFALHAPQIGYLQHGMDDDGQDVPGEWFEAAIRWIEAVWLADPQAVLLTHCHMGINRGPSLGFAVLLFQGWDPVDAITALRAARPQANVWYAADALTWHHQRTGVNKRTAAQQHAELNDWRKRNPLDVVRILRQARAEQASRRGSG